MSIHALLGQSLDDLELPGTSPYFEAIAENQITRARNTGLIDEEDFHYYSARLRRICEQRKEAA